MTDGRHLLVQAGTGTGKSLAYLVPACCTATPWWSPRRPSRCRTRWSTVTCRRWSTRSSRCSAGDRRTRSSRAGPTTCAATRCWAGCPTTTATRCSTRRPRRRSAGTWCGCASWADETETGDRDELDPGVNDRAWRQVSVSARECLGAAEVPVRRASASPSWPATGPREVDVVVTNHALLAIDALESFAVLPEHDAVVVDEAHELVDRVTGVATDELTAAMVERAAARARRIVDGTDDLTDAAAALEKALATLPEGRVVELPEAAGSPRWPWSATPRATSSPRSAGPSRPTTAQRKVALSAMVEAVHETAERVAAHSPYDVSWVSHDAAARAGAQGGAAVGQRAAARGAVRRAVGGAHQRHPRARRVVRPGGPPGRAHRRRRPGVDRARRRLAVRLPEPGRSCTSPAGCPRPGRDGASPAAMDELADTGRGRRRPDAGAVLLDACRRGRRGRDARAAGRARCCARARTGPPRWCRRSPPTRRPACSARCRCGRGSTCPGDACRLVVIDRIPFPRPDDPLMSARAQAVEDAGGNGFMTVSATHAALRLAQGAGRLIRRSGDRGVVAVLDSRLATARYAGFLRVVAAAVLVHHRPRGGGRAPCAGWAHGPPEVTTDHQA